MKQETIDYFRSRQRAERDAMRNATSDEARWAHEQMADAYARLVELEEMKAAGKVVSVAEALRARDDTVYGRPAMPSRGAPQALAQQA